VEIEALRILPLSDLDLDPSGPIAV